MKTFLEKQKLFRLHKQCATTSNTRTSTSTHRLSQLEHGIFKFHNIASAPRQHPPPIIPNIQFHTTGPNSTPKHPPDNDVSENASILCGLNNLDGSWASRTTAVNHRTCGFKPESFALHTSGRCSGPWLGSPYQFGTLYIAH